MSHSISKIWVHGVFITKERMPLIKKKFETELYLHLKEILIQHFHCYVQAINGTEDHIHILFLLNQNHSIQDIFHYIKGKSSHWINQNNFTADKFNWQIGYGAFSIGESAVRNVEKYVMNQKKHHSNKSFNDEMNSFADKYKIGLD